MENDLNYIKKFTSLRVKYICNELKVNYQNVMNGKASAKTIKRVKNELERRLKEL